MTGPYQRLVRNDLVVSYSPSDYGQRTKVICAGLFRGQNELLTVSGHIRAHGLDEMKGNV